METSHDENAGKLPAPEEKPLLSRLLPWLVLLLAALALLYFLGRGCAGAKNRPADTKEATEMSASDDAKSASPNETEKQETKMEGKPIELPGGSKLSASEGSFLAKLTAALSAGDVNANSAFILDYGDFQGKSAIPTPQSEKELEQLATLLKAYPNTKIRIEAHTDNTGNADINMQLSTQQALSIRSFLMERGIALERMATVGRGQTKPIGPNDTDAGKALNKRIEIYVVN